jgi:two-component system CheB/CheR fusion protein
MIVFRDATKTEPERSGKPRSVSEQKLNERIEELESDLRYTKEHLQSTIEEMETTNEELQSSNEELQSANEELQSTNEGIETSKEELQSTNEELITVNAELQEKMDELAETNNDMANLLASTRGATLFLDNELRIKRFTHGVAGFINLIQSDVGRPLGDFSKRIEYPELEQDARAVLASLDIKERAVRHVDKAWYIVRIIPYQTSKDVIEGVVITFVEISEQKRMQALQDALAFSRAIVDTVREPLIVLDGSLRVIGANRAFYDLFRTAPEEVEHRLLVDLGDRQWDIPALRTALEDILPTSSKLDDFVVEHDFPLLGHRKMVLNARRIELADAETHTILLAIEARP